MSPFHLENFMGNSTYRIQDLVDDARTMGDLAPTLPQGGYFEVTALSAANDTMTAMLAGSSHGSPFNFKFNRVQLPQFYLNSWQQDYATHDVINLGWLESAGGYNMSSTQYPKPYRPIEVKRDVLESSGQASSIAKISWVQNDSLTYGTWGQSQQASVVGLLNPGPNVVYTSPVGQTAIPINPVTQVQDSFGNLWVLTQYGTCGSSNPFATNQNPSNVYRTQSSTNEVVVTDGTVKWTSVNPKGQGYRLHPRPGQTGPVWIIAPIGQTRVPKFTKLTDYIEPIPDDFIMYFKQGFFAQLYRRSPDPKVRAKFADEYKIWMKALDDAVRQGSREQDDWGFIPATSVMDTGWATNPINPAQPYGPWSC
jgi:hypothetical protein